MYNTLGNLREVDDSLWRDIGGFDIVYLTTSLGRKQADLPESVARYKRQVVNAFSKRYTALTVGEVTDVVNKCVPSVDMNLLHTSERVSFVNCSDAALQQLIQAKADAAAKAKVDTSAKKSVAAEEEKTNWGLYIGIGAAVLIGIYLLK